MGRHVLGKNRLYVNLEADLELPRAIERQVWSGQQVRRFLELASGDRHYWPWLFLATTGCRRGEARPAMG